MPLPDNRAPTCVAEIKPGAVFVGFEYDQRQNDGLIEVNWKSRKINRVSGPRPTIRRIVRTPDGRVFAASWFSLYEKPSRQ